MIPTLGPLALLELGWRDVVEVVLVAYGIYRLLRLLEGTRAVQILAGVVVLVLGYWAASLAGLTMITWLLGLVFTYGAFAAIVVFQPELRQALAHLGKARVTRFLRRLGDEEVAQELTEAVERLSRAGSGAIIAVERDVGLSDYVQSGAELQAKVSADLMATIFTPYSPLHDGAVVVRGDTIIGAGCILPLSQAPLADRTLGTRHRAALGLSEETDALVIIVSEETSVISAALGGRLLRNLTADDVGELLAGGMPGEPSAAAARVPA